MEVYPQIYTLIRGRWEHLIGLTKAALKKEPMYLFDSVENSYCRSRSGS